MRPKHPILPLFPELVDYLVKAQLEPDGGEGLIGETLSGFLFPTLVFDRKVSIAEEYTREFEDSQLYEISTQLCLELFLPDNISQFSKFVSPRRNGLLDRNFLSFSAKDTRLHKLAFELYELGVIRLGHVVQMSEDEIRNSTSATDATMRRLKTLLSAADLGLGMKTLGWKPGQARSL